MAASPSGIFAFGDPPSDRAQFLEHRPASFFPLKTTSRRRTICGRDHEGARTNPLVIKAGLNFGQDDAKDEWKLLSMMEGDRAKPKALLHEGRLNKEKGVFVGRAENREEKR